MIGDRNSVFMDGDTNQFDAVYETQTPLPLASRQMFLFYYIHDEFKKMTFFNTPTRYM